MSNCCNDSLVESLRRNIGKVIIVFTKSCCQGLTGLLAEVQGNDTIKLITTLPSAPINPFEDEYNDRFEHGGRGCGCRNHHNKNEFGNLCGGRCRPSHFGSVTIIPIDQITSCVFAEV